MTLRAAADSAATVDRIAGPVGKVFVKDPKHHTYRILLGRGMAGKTALAKIRANKAVLQARVYYPPPVHSLGNLKSARTINRTIRGLESRENAGKSEAEREREERRSGPRLAVIRARGRGR